MNPVNRNPSRRTLNQFGGIWILFFGLVGTLVLRKTGNVTRAIEIWAGASAIAGVGFLFHPFLRLLFVGLSYLTYPIGWVLSHLILAGVYYLVLTPIALAMRLLGHDPIPRKLDRTAETYWVPRKGETDTSRYFRQF